jgi:hypothetical protein
LKDLGRWTDPQQQRSPETSIFPFPAATLANLPADFHDSVPMNAYEHYPVYGKLRQEQERKGNGDRPGSLLYEFGVLVTAFGIIEMLMAGMESLHACLSMAGVRLGEAHRTMISAINTCLFNLRWLQALFRGRLNTIETFTRLGRSGMVYTHQAYFGNASNPLADHITKDLDEAVLKATNKATAAALAAENLRRLNRQQGNQREGVAGRGGGRGGRGGRGAGGRGGQYAPAQAAAAGGGN